MTSADIGPGVSINDARTYAWDGTTGLVEGRPDLRICYFKGLGDAKSRRLEVWVPMAYAIQIEQETDTTLPLAKRNTYQIKHLVRDYHAASVHDVTPD